MFTTTITAMACVGCGTWGQWERITLTEADDLASIRASLCPRCAAQTTPAPTVQSLHHGRYYAVAPDAECYYVSFHRSGWALFQAATGQRMKQILSPFGWHATTLIHATSLSHYYQVEPAPRPVPKLRAVPWLSLALNNAPYNVPCSQCERISPRVAGPRTLTLLANGSVRVTTYCEHCQRMPSALEDGHLVQILAPPDEPWWDEE